MIGTGDRTAAYLADDPAACTCANLRKAARAVTQTYDAALQPVGLKATQFTVLATLSRHASLPLSRLAEVMVMDRTTLSRNLKPLLGRELVRIERATDRRVREISLTAAGREALDEALPRWRQAQSQLVGALGTARWSAMLDDIAATVAVTRHA